MFITKPRDFGHTNMSDWVNGTQYFGCWKGTINLDLHIC